jgi:hypothetical protein
MDTRCGVTSPKQVRWMFGLSHKGLGLPFDKLLVSFLTSHSSIASLHSNHTMKLTAVLANIVAIMAVATCIEASAITNCVVDRVKTSGDKSAGSLGNVKRKYAQSIYHPGEVLICIRQISNFFCVNAFNPIIGLHRLERLHGYRQG